MMAAPHNVYLFTDAMRTKNNLILILILAFNLSIGNQAKAISPRQKEDSFRKLNAVKYLEAVKKFADQALVVGKDHYGPLTTPLFVDGINVKTDEPVTWRFPGGKDWVLVNLGNQQNFFRTLVGLTNLSGDPKYKQAAKEAIRYAFDHVRFGGLMAWGGHMAYNATADSVVFAPDKSKTHELKSHYPFYELMWEVDPRETRMMIEEIWNSHILNWENLDFNRHGYITPVGKLWENEYKPGKVFFWGKGLTFLNAGSDLYYAAAMLSYLSKDSKPLIWAKRLAYRYVETRDPKSGLSGFQFSQTNAWCDDKGTILGDRAIYQYGDDFPGHLVVEGTLFPCYGNVPAIKPELCNLAISAFLGEKGKDFERWTIENLISWAKSSYREADNCFVPMLTDGTSMEGYICKKEGYFGPKGRVLKAGKAGTELFGVYAKACEVSNDSLIWKMTRNIALANQLGDIGLGGKNSEHLNLKTNCADYQALYGFLSLYKRTDKKIFLEMAVAIGNNIINSKMVNGFFTYSTTKSFARFDNIEPLALLQLASVLMNRPGLVPAYPGGTGFFASAYSNLGHKYDNEFIYDLTDNE